MITGFVGLPRSGKTTLVGRYLKKNYWRYDHIYVAGDRIITDELDDFVTYIHPYEIGSFKPVFNSLFVLCEAGTYFNNRLFSVIPSYCTDFFCLHGHYGCDIVWESQDADVDKKLLSRTNYLFLVRKCLISYFTRSERLLKRFTVNRTTNDIQIVYDIPETFLQRLISWLTFRVQYIYRPLSYGVFDTHADIMFDGRSILDKKRVFSQCPTSFINELKLYKKLLKEFES